MPHSFPSGLTALIARRAAASVPGSAGWYGKVPAVIITLGDGVTTLKYSTENITVGADTFVDRLKYVGALKQSMTRAVDRVPIQLWNADSQAGLALIDPVEALDGAKAVYSRIFVNPSDPNEKYLVEELAGVLAVDPGAGAGDEIVAMTLVSDTAARPSIVGNFPILPACANQFKAGLTNPFEVCDYSGPLPTCDLTYDGANGCRVHFSEAEAIAKFGGHARDLDQGTITQQETNNRGPNREVIADIRQQAPVDLPNPRYPNPQPIRNVGGGLRTIGRL
jgi:hypothetical protein